MTHFENYLQIKHSKLFDTFENTLVQEFLENKAVLTLMVSARDETFSAGEVFMLKAILAAYTLEFYPGVRDRLILDGKLKPMGPLPGVIICKN